jgi:hypothetical protein
VAVRVAVFVAVSVAVRVAVFVAVRVAGGAAGGVAVVAAVAVGAVGRVTATRGPAADRADCRLPTAGFQLLSTLQAASCHGHCRLAGTGGHWAPMATFIINISGEEGGKGARELSVNYFYFSFFP